MNEKGAPVAALFFCARLLELERRDAVDAREIDLRRLAGGGGEAENDYATGFINFEYGMGAKWLELLKQMAPGAHRRLRQSHSQGRVTIRPQGRVTIRRGPSGGLMDAVAETAARIQNRAGNVGLVECSTTRYGPPMVAVGVGAAKRFADIPSVQWPAEFDVGEHHVDMRVIDKLGNRGFRGFRLEHVAAGVTEIFRDSISYDPLVFDHQNGQSRNNARLL